MEKKFIKSSAYSLILGSLLASLTMILHPAGGKLDEIANQKHMLMHSHLLAIFSLPFICFGFLGIARYLVTETKISFLAFIISCFGLFSAMIAASINGMALPMFADKYASGNIQYNMLKAIMDYWSLMNISHARIFISSIVVSIGIWSFIIIRTSKLSKFIGYLGYIIIVCLLTGVFFTFNFTNVSGFSITTFGIMAWTLSVGFCMLKQSNQNNNQQ